jgi:hypothetical protein
LVAAEVAILLVQVRLVDQAGVLGIPTLQILQEHLAKGLQAELATGLMPAHRIPPGHLAVVVVLGLRAQMPKPM